MGSGPAGHAPIDERLLLLATVLFVSANRNVARIELAGEDRRRLIHDLEQAVPDGSAVAGIIVDEPAQPLVSIPGGRDRMAG